MTHQQYSGAVEPGDDDDKDEWADFYSGKRIRPTGWWVVAVWAFTSWVIGYRVSIESDPLLRVLDGLLPAAVYGAIGAAVLLFVRRLRRGRKGEREVHNPTEGGRRVGLPVLAATVVLAVGLGFLWGRSTGGTSDTDLTSADVADSHFLCVESATRWGDLNQRSTDYEEQRIAIIADMYTAAEGNVELQEAIRALEESGLSFEIAANDFDLWVEANCAPEDPSYR